MISFVRDFFDSNTLSDRVNETIIVLLAKVAKPDLISQFRPISLCNVIYKALVNRLRPILNDLIARLKEASFRGCRLRTILSSCRN